MRPLSVRPRITIATLTPPLPRPIPRPPPLAETPPLPLPLAAPPPNQTYFFELTDLYDKKNMPKVVYMIHALAYVQAFCNAPAGPLRLVARLTVSRFALSTLTGTTCTSAGSRLR